MKTEYISEAQVFHGGIPLVMGTKLEVLLAGVTEGKGLHVWDQLHDLVFSLDRMLNRFDPGSEVSQLNLSQTPLAIGAGGEIGEIIRLALQYKAKTAGLFDICMSDGKLDFGGFAKGYFLRRCAAMLREAGIECAFVDFGGSSILGIGHHPYGDSWKVGILNPYTHMSIGEIELQDSSLSTSGNTPAYTGHIRNPKTGEVCTARMLATVVSKDPLDAEVLSTVMMIASPHEQEEIRRNFPEAVIKSHVL